MAELRHREETANTQLAVLISRYGVTADAESIQVRGRHRPDVLFTWRGLRVVIEGKFADHPNAEQAVLEDARHRVAKGIAHIAAAVVYPKGLRAVSTSRLERALESTRLTYRIVSESGESEEAIQGDPRALMEALRRAQEALARDNVVERTALSLSDRLEGVAKLWSGQKGACDRLSRLLGMNIPRSEAAEKAAARREAAAKVSALVIANALIFQELLSQADSRVQPLRKIEKLRDPVSESKSHWNWIWTHVNYVPIFQLGERVLDELPGDAHTTIAFRALRKEAQEICCNQAALRHDLMGRIYHWLLHHGKFLGTYYTSVSAATLLLKLALTEPWKTDFGNPTALMDFKIGDLACGTGTLLMAAAQAISDAYIGVRAGTGRSLNPTDLQTLHRALMENVLHGYDVLPSAIHLTASTLATLAPEVSFVKMNLFIMPLGLDGNTPRLGSLDFFSDQSIPVQVSLDNSQAETIRASARAATIAKAHIPDLDLCVMNPPFVRSVGGNLLFGSLPDERGRLQTELKSVVRAAVRKGYPSSITAGLGSVFLALAVMRLKEGGRIAFVLPAAVASGEAWAETRRLISKDLQLEMVVTSHDATAANFSENTALSELLLIARKVGRHESASRTTYVNLWRNPKTIHEALDMADRIRQTKPALLEDEEVASIIGQSSKLGEVLSTPTPKDESSWTAALFSRSQLLRTFIGIDSGVVNVPGNHGVHLPMVRLRDLGELGPDRKRIHEGFKISNKDWSPHPAFWGHDSTKVKTIRQTPNSHLIPWRASPRGPHYGEHLWERAGRILLVERVRTNTHRVIAVGLEKEVLGNTWWALRSPLTLPQEKALLLWLNGTPGILSMYGRRVVTEGAWMQMKQPAWESMPVLDVHALKSSHVTELAIAYDHIANQDLKAIAQLATDPIRQVIDGALSKTLDLPDLANLRTLLSLEPGLSGLSRNMGSHDLSKRDDTDAVEEEELLKDL